MLGRKVCSKLYIWHFNEIVKLINCQGEKWIIIRKKVQGDAYASCRMLTAVNTYNMKNLHFSFTLLPSMCILYCQPALDKFLLLVVVSKICFRRSINATKWNQSFVWNLLLINMKTCSQLHVESLSHSLLVNKGTPTLYKFRVCTSILFFMF